MPRFAAVRRLLEGVPGAEVALRELYTAEHELNQTADIVPRMLELNDAMCAVASLRFDQLPEIRDDGSVMDASFACVRMLAEELQARLDERDRVEKELEDRVAARTQALQTEIDERRRTEATLREREAQLVQASKLAAVGQLAAGIAHEINNPLAVILGFAQGLERRTTDTPQFKKPIESIAREAVRCKNLVEQLLTFSRRGQRSSKEPVDLSSVLENAAHLLRSRARTQQTELKFDVGAHLPKVEGNRTQLEQVVINLGVNALDALKSGGEVTFTLGEQRTARGAHLALEVHDNGPGIPDEVRAHLFEPFFTTKEVGKGTGLGLSLSYEIVSQHGGKLSVDTAVGLGTTMRVELPTVLTLNP
jgi:two-component system, NtrC family, sensor kinase